MLLVVFKFFIVFNGYLDIKFEGRFKKRKIATSLKLILIFIVKVLTLTCKYP